MPGAHDPASKRVRRWAVVVRRRLREPAVLAIVAVVFFVSAVGQAVVSAYVGEDSVVVTALFSVLGSMFVAAAIIVAARGDGR